MRGVFHLRKWFWEVIIIVMTIHPSAIIHPSVHLGRNVSVGPFSVINENVVIGDDSVIGSHTEIGIPHQENLGQLFIGPRSVIRSHTVLYSGSSFEERLETGHHVSIREGTKAGKNLRVGSYSDIQGDVEIGDFVRLHSNVHLGKQTKIGNYVWIFPFVVTTNDPQPPSEQVLGCQIEDYVAIATGAILLPGIHVGHDSLVGANSTVNKNVEPFSLIVGSPGRKIKDVRDLKGADSTQSYPWRMHFKRGYPEDVIRSWEEEFKVNQLNLREP
jgi:acyl-[acyl carrier protein]--UDP-N-acetylglucosamine O-acyltransferase